MGYFQVRYDSRVVIYDRRAFIRLSTGHTGWQWVKKLIFFSSENGKKPIRRFFGRRLPSFLVLLHSM